MAMLRFRRVELADWLLLADKDQNTRYTVVNEDGSIYGEYIGDKKITEHIEVEAEKYFKYLNMEEGFLIDIDSECDEETIYMNVQIYSDEFTGTGLILLQTRDQGDEYFHQIVFDPVNGGDIWTRSTLSSESPPMEWSPWKKKGYEPDEVTIVVNEEDKLKVSKSLEIDGGFL